MATISLQGRALAMRVLICGENLRELLTLEAVLNVDGFAVELMLSTHAALRAARANWPDVVLIDPEMPGAGAFDLASRLRNLAGERRLLIIEILDDRTAGDVERRKPAAVDHQIARRRDVKVLTLLLANYRASAVPRETIDAARVITVQLATQDKK